MNNNTLALIKEVRAKTGAGILVAKAALEKADWDITVACKVIEEEQRRRPQRDTSYSAIFQYNHNNRIASTLVLSCGTDFVGLTEEFKALGVILAQQVVGASPRTVEELLEQDFLRDPKVKVKDKIAELSRKVQEDITVVRFSREQL